MSKKQLVIQHDLSKLSPEELTQYLRDVSAFIGLDPDLNGLDTIWMQNENGPGQSLVVYARRGTAEILRDINGIEVDSLTDKMVNGSIVFTATGKNKDKRQEIATGSKYITGLQGKALDDAIMTASTRAIRRLTMQFTKLGILDQSEVEAVVGSTANPAAGATLVNGPMVIPPAVAPNNAPGKDITPTAQNPTADPNHPSITKIPDSPETRHAVALKPELVDQTTSIRQVYAEGAAALAAMPGTVSPAGPVSTPVETAPKTEKPKRARKSRNTVSMDGPEPEVVSTPAPALPAPLVTVPATVTVTNNPVAAPVPTQVNPVVPEQVDYAGKPTQEQMVDYRRRLVVYTAELPSSEGLGSVPKMRAFITHMMGTPPQFMTTDQWEEALSWFEGFVAKNQMKGLVKYINDTLGVK
jgi:hypothetical protein